VGKEGSLLFDVGEKNCTGEKSRLNLAEKTLRGGGSTKDGNVSEVTIRNQSQISSCTSLCNPPIVPKKR